MTTEEQTLSKSEFARHCNVDKSRVSHWIGDGKIFGDAIVGEGRSAKIRVEVAKAQLRRNLDIDQRHGNGLSTRLDPGLPLIPPVAHAPAPPPLLPVDPVEEKIKQERLEALQRQNRKAAEEEAARAGRYVLADEMERQVGRATQDMLTAFEGAFSDFATALNARFKIPHRDALHEIRTEFRKIRERRSATLQSAAAALPAMIEAEVSPPASDAAAAPSERVMADGDHAGECRAPDDGGDGVGAEAATAD